MPIWERPSSTPTFPTSAAGNRISSRTLTHAERTTLTQYPHALIELTVASAVAWLMMRAGLAKNVLEVKRKRQRCAACGRIDGCNCF